MAVQYNCDHCGRGLETEEVYRKKVTYHNAKTTKMAASYTLEGEYCIYCVREEAERNRKPKGRRTTPKS